MKLTLTIQKATKHLKKIPPRKDFMLWVKSALQLLEISNQNIEITIRLVDESESAALNQQYRHKQGPTNILSFGFDNIPKANPYYLGDLLICVPLVFKEAKEQNKLMIAHWAHLIVHGTLHLLGYDHIKKKDATKMEALEIKLLQELGYKNPYITNKEETLCQSN